MGLNGANSRIQSEALNPGAWYLLQHQSRYYHDGEQSKAAKMAGKNCTQHNNYGIWEQKKYNATSANDTGTTKGKLGSKPSECRVLPQYDTERQQQ